MEIFLKQGFHLVIVMLLGVIDFNFSFQNLFFAHFLFFFVFLYFNTYPFPTVNTISSFISAFVQDFSECRAHVFIFNQVLSLQRRNIFHKLFELHSVFVIFLLQHLLLPQLIRQLGSLGNYQRSFCETILGNP